MQAEPCEAAMTSLAAEARIRVSASARCLDQMVSHFLEHDAQITALPDGSHRCGFGHATTYLRAEGDEIWLRVEATDLGNLATGKMMLLGHLEEAASGETLQAVWRGDGEGLSTPPQFRRMQVLRAQWVTPQMRRLTLRGEDLGRFASLEHLHVKLLIPREQVEPVWPRLDASGRLVQGEEARRPVRRTYTLRRVDVAAGQVEIDFVTHGEGSPGSRLAIRAQPGDVVGMFGPGGGAPRAADWTLLAGDETALPAIARILEAMPRDARGMAFIEVSGAAERQDLIAPAGVEVHWLYRESAAPGTTSLLPDAVCAASWPSDEGAFAWAGCEFAAVQRLRRHCRMDRGLDKNGHLAVAYWRRGVEEGGFEKTAAEEAGAAAASVRPG
ncbi:DUF2218 domain-containing protein [Pseudoroseomonas globiformis]|uniref:DUF2218 domain-containing protein n=1 Tax=Teichococcus globiformis TaxID=2307229 RepID=A0ABV7G6Y7_9PROT